MTTPSNPQREIVTCADCRDTFTYLGTGNPPSRCADCQSSQAASS